MYESPVVSSALVIGGGIFGVSSAWHLMRLGVRTTLVNDGPLANGASGRSLAWLNSTRRRSLAYHQLRMAGIDRYRILATRPPDAKWLRFDGGLTWDTDDDGNEIADAFAHEGTLAYDAVRFRAEEVATVTPGVDARAVTRQGAIFNAGEGWVDLPCLIDHLAKGFVAMGGTIVIDAGKAAVVVEVDRSGRPGHGRGHGGKDRGCHADRPFGGHQAAQPFVASRAQYAAGRHSPEAGRRFRARFRLVGRGGRHCRRRQLRNPRLHRRRPAR